MLLSRVFLLMAEAMRHANGDVGAGVGAEPNLTDASQPIPLRANCRNSKVWAYANFRSALEFRRSHIEAELGEFVEGD